MLSARYIQARFLPDKAIDLIDEAASRLRIEIDSKPEEVDKLERKILELEIQKQAIRKDGSSSQQLKKIDAQIKPLNDELAMLKTHWQKEKDLITQIRKIKEDIEKIKLQSTELERQGDLAKVAENRYGKIPELEGELNELNKNLNELQAGMKMLKEEVDEEDISEIVSRWTGIPVTSLLEEDVKKLLRMEEKL